MSSAIFLAERYMEGPVFEYYFRGPLHSNGLAVGSVHGFEENNNNKFIFTVMGQERLKERVYDVMGEVIPVIEKEAESGGWANMGRNSLKDWQMGYPTLIDIKPRVIGGVYLDDKTAELLFPVVALDYIAGATGDRFESVIKEVRGSLSSLGDCLKDI